MKKRKKNAVEEPDLFQDLQEAYFDLHPKEDEWRAAQRKQTAFTTQRARETQCKS